jgi:hypothetical protein
MLLHVGLLSTFSGCRCLGLGIRGCWIYFQGVGCVSDWVLGSSFSNSIHDLDYDSLAGWLLIVLQSARNTHVGDQRGLAWSRDRSQSS